ncbi:zwei Ig domain protein zig-8 isoform X1 [Drosophila gunungcola]|uniref:zwei Ig domain protein zig-8 isoform X1 n=2 Tax=elegans subgroup (in: flies) TaxID=32348 RepID=UPI0022E788B1|nr:zwei Ig domain protein zig-8 isoform X1 [Drosophila gunungcola]XP_052857107.1 zwei Ig domain protein zig-8 isoform X1 [Drosophila gunungcola]XP_052857108.1 zwei Ig domain protein zig-8 isoform X1 [Drosophila gunungcola]
MSTHWLILLGTLCLLAGCTDGASKRFFTDFLQDLPTPGTGGPTFDTTIGTNITGLVGKTVKLTCRVKNLGNRTVSWVRHRDIHLLTVGRYTYTSDQRFEAMHSPHAEDWTLRIRYAQRKDSGIYECQISTTPPIGHSVYLNIVEPVTDIIGGPDLHINRGSTINLTCIVKFAPEPPPTVVWSHNREIINFDSPRGGISLVTEKGVLTTSRLLVQKAITQDSGLYTCTPSNANPSSVRVHIVDGEHPAAMHTGNNGNSTAPQPPVLLPLVLLTCGTLMLLQLVACCCSAAALVPATPPGRSNVHRPGTTLTKDTARGQRSTRNCQTLGEAGFFQKEDLCRRGFEIRPVPGT